ncbi:unnamed protein product [Knipowitschia caucasica]
MLLLSMSKDREMREMLQIQQHEEKPPGESWPRSEAPYRGEKCERNTSVSLTPGFSLLPALTQDFLSLRHCRHFPMLLDVTDKSEKPWDDIFLLLVIKSSPQNFERRQVLRQTWAEERSYWGKTIRRVFISGTRGSGEERRHLDQLLQEEGRTYGDLLQWDFTDSFYNLTLKQLLFLDWFQTRSRRCRFLMSGDDDIFANTDNMVEFLLSRHGNDGDQHLFVGESDGSV